MLPGMHRVHRGAEVAFEAVATEIARMGMDEVTVVGSGPQRGDRPYEYRRRGLVAREHFERFPKFPVFRSEYIYEEFTWIANSFPRYRPSATDITVTCSFPFVHWMLARWPPVRRKPAHVFVTQNGDHPAFADHREYRSFRCDGLVCTNPIYYERNKERWPSMLVPNGIDPERFRPGPSVREELGLPASGPIVLMVSALVDSKRVLEAMASVARIPDATLVVAGDGPLRERFDVLGAELMPGRHRRMTLPADRMPDLYRSADVLLHPTLFESFGNVYIEAMAVGLPVVAHDSAVTRWIMGDRTGLVDTTDSAAMTAAVELELENGRDEALERSASVAERFAWSTIAHHYRDFFQELLERRDTAR
jgi:glycosyltransferase involved in cell wall biosynthesis